MANGSLPILDETFENGSTTECPDVNLKYLEAKARYYRIVVNIWILSILCIVGLIGNTLTYIVLKSDKSRRSATYLLRVLAIADNIYLIICISNKVFYTLYYATHYNRYLRTWYPYIYPYIFVLGPIFQTFSQWTLVLATIERYLIVCKPLWKRTHKISSYLRRATPFLPIIATIYFIPRFFERETVFSKICNVTFVEVKTTWVHDHKMYLIVQHLLCYALFRLVLPIGILIFCNVNLILAMRRSQERLRQTATEFKTPNTRITAMLVVVSLVFIVCHVPGSASRFMHGHKHYYEVSITSNLFLTINSAINSFIYCFVWRAFRIKFIKLFSCRNRARLDSAQSSTTTSTGNTLNLM